MIVQLRSELLKIRSTRTTAGLALTMLALVLLFVLLGGLVGHPADLDGTDDQTNLLGIGGVSTLFAAIAGVLLVTSEFRYGTIRSTLVVTPRRRRVLGAKLAASLLAGAVFGVVGEGLALGIGLLILHARGIPVVLDGGELVLIGLGTVAGSALWAAIGVGIGTAVRAQIPAIVGLFAWVLVLENLLFGLVPSVGRYFPGQAESALADSPTAHLLSPAGGAAMLVAWTAACALAGLAVLEARDVD